MLPLDLLRYQTHGGDIRVVYVNPESKKYLAIATDLIEIFTAYVGKRKGELAEVLADYEAADTNYHVTRGLGKLLEDLSEFTIQSTIEPETLRERIFAHTSAYYPVVTQIDLLHRHTRCDALAAIAHDLGISPEEVGAGMYADLEENRVLAKFDPPTPRWLLDRYNVALAQAMLYRASEMTIRIYRNIPTKYKLVFKFIKFFQLMHVISGNNADGYRIVLDGPASMFRLSQKYGVQMALFLPALLHCERWWMDATIILNKNNRYRFKLTDEFGLRSHYRDPGEFDSELERRFALQFNELDTAWTLERETDIIDLKDTVMIPDFNFVHPDGRWAMMEIVGFWTPDYLQKKLWKLKRADKRNMVIAVSGQLNCGEEDFRDIPGEVLFFKTQIKPKDVLEKVEACTALV
jgi:hypothetical protein